MTPASLDLALKLPSTGEGSKNWSRSDNLSPSRVRLQTERRNQPSAGSPKRTYATPELVTAPARLQSFLISLSKLEAEHDALRDRRGEIEAAAIYRSAESGNAAEDGPDIRESARTEARARERKKRQRL